MHNKNKIEKKPVRYALAKGTERIWARIIDIIFASIIIFAFACLVFLTDPGFIKYHNFNQPFQSWRYLLFSLITTTLWFLYFIVLPTFWKGQTLGMKAFKLATYNQVFGHFMFNIFKKELWVWGIPVIAQLLLGLSFSIIGWTNNDSVAFTAFTEMFNTKTNDQSAKIFGIVFGSVFGLSILILIFVTIDVGVHPNRQAFIDKRSNTCVVKKIDVLGNNGENDNKNLKNKPIRRNYALPGAILDSPHDTIDSLDEIEEEK